MASSGAYYITTPIYYVNDVPHLGHAYTTIACDAIARYRRLDGQEVMFLTGTDEHGQKVEKSAQALGEDPQSFTDRVSQRFRDLTDLLGSTNDDFIRTTEARHTTASQAIWKALEESGDIYLGSYAGWYSVRDEAFFAESEVTKAADGTRVGPTGAPVEWVEEPSYFFRLSQWQDRLIDYYNSEPKRIMPESRRNEVVSFVKGGLQDLSISRTSFKWGIPVPSDESHIMYVWLDALTNYITAAGYPDTESKPFDTFWPASVHVVGKDILRFHAVYWPAFLMAAGLEPPERVFAHGWWTVEGQKMSKSLGNVIEPFQLMEEYGLDQVRYFLLREVPFGNDGDFSKTSLVNRINHELANDYGNLAQRVLSMIKKNCGSKVPVVGALTDDDQALLKQCDGLLGTTRERIDDLALHEVLDVIWQVIRKANVYVDHQAPWALRKSDPERMATVLYVLAECLRHLAILTQPFVPDASEKLLDQLGVDVSARAFDCLGPEHALVSGSDLPPPVGIFPRRVDSETETAKAS